MTEQFANLIEKKHPFDEQRKNLELFVADVFLYGVDYVDSAGNEHSREIENKRDKVNAAVAAREKALLDRIERLEKALKPFAHEDLSKIVGGNAVGDESIVFQRDKAILRIKDFKDAIREAKGGNK